MSTQRNDRQRFNRRFRFSMSVLAAQLLLGAVAITWCVHMVLILIHGEVCFQEPNSAILYTEIAATAIVIIYSAKGGIAKPTGSTVKYIGKTGYRSQLNSSFNLTYYLTPLGVMPESVLI